MPSPAISVVCPFYNEEAILELAVEGMLENLRPYGDSVELIIVNDGSTDESRNIALSLQEKHPGLVVLSYEKNQGRGYALKTGIDGARGEIIVTTEIDLSWGDDIVERLVDALRKNPKWDMVIASPHSEGGGYKNVPANRVWLSRMGNVLLRSCISTRIRMYTGMTRAYRADKIKSIPLFEKSKEFHLEVIMKALSLGWEIGEIPCVLEWKAHKLVKTPAKPIRKSSTTLSRFIVSHLAFSLTANPVKYLLFLGVSGVLCSAVFLFASIVRFIMGLVAIYLFQLSVLSLILGLVLILFSLLAKQNSALQTEMWRLQAQILELDHKRSKTRNVPGDENR